MNPQNSPIDVVVAHSDEVDDLEAIEDVLTQCRERLAGRRPVAALLHASVEYEHSEILRKIAEEWPGLPLVGGTTDGEVSSSAGFLPDSILLTLFVGDNFEAVSCVGENLSQDIEACVDSALEGLRSEPPKLIITNFAPTTNASEVLRVLDAKLGDRHGPIVGGLSGDHREFVNMSEFAGSQRYSDSLPILALYGDLHVSWGVASGWFPIGSRMKVTKSDGHLVHEIEGRPAYETYKHYYKEISLQSLGEHPLALCEGDSDSDYVMRAVVEFVPETGSLRFAGEVPEGAEVRMTEVLPEGVLDGSRESVQSALSSYSGESPELAFLFTCAARQWALGGRAEEELETVRAALPTAGGKPIQVAGFYAFGEILPGAEARTTRFHNETCVSLLFGR